MTAFGRGLGPAMAVFALVLAASAGAQENLDSGKNGAQLYAANCAICHKNPQTLNKSGGLFGLSGFLREHYTASKESAASIAAYLGTVGNAPGPGKRGSKRAAKGENKDKLGEEKKGKTKTGEAKGEDKDIDAEKKPKTESDKEKAKVDAEKKPKAKTDKAEKSEKSEKTRKEETKRAEPKDESKPEQKSEKKTEKKSSGTKSGESKAKESKDSKDKDVKDNDAKASPPKEAEAKKKPGSAATAKPDKKDKSD